MIHAMVHAKVSLVYDFSVLGKLEQKQDYMTKYQLCVANGVIDTNSNVPIGIFVSYY